LQRDFLQPLPTNAILWYELPFATKLGILQRFLVVAQGLEVCSVIWTVPLQNSSQSEVIFPNSHLSNLEFLKFSQEKHSSLYTPQMVLSITQWCMIPHQDTSQQCLLFLPTSKKLIWSFKQG
jgi:hypothetical protein